MTPKEQMVQPQMASATRLSLGMLRQLAVRQRWYLAAAGLAMIIAALLAAIVPVIVGQLVNNVVAKPGAAHGILVTGLIVVAVILLATQILQVVRRQFVESVATAYERDLRTRAYRHVLHQDVSHIQQGQIGSIYGRINRGIEGSTKLLKLSFMEFLPTTALALAALLIAFLRNPLIALIMACVIPTGFALVMWQIRNQAGIRVQVRTNKENIDGQVVELLPALETVRAYNAQGYFSDRVASTARTLRDSEMQHHRAMGWFDAGKYTNETFWYVAVLSFAIYLATLGRFGPGEVLTYALLFNNIIAPLRELHRIIDEASENTQQAYDLAELLRRPLDSSFNAHGDGRNSADRPEIPISSQAYGTISPGDLETVISIRDLLFAYEGSDGSTVLNGINMTVQAGERIGLAGPSGCGKSTLLKILDRLQHGYVGNIELFGLPLTTFNRDELSRKVAYVSQRYFLYRGTIYDNIVFGHKGEISYEEVAEAARRANIHDVIMNFPDGYQTLVSERGDSLSGGQAQRICIARALLRRPQLLLLDEPTSALDNESQRIVQSAIDELTGITILEVAHRLDTLRTADRIYVLEAGRIEEQGTYDELEHADGVFTRLLRRSHEPEGY